MLKNLIAKIERRTKPLKPYSGPQTVMIEPNNVCNLQCPGCPTGLGIMERPPGQMPLADFRIIVDKIKPAPQRILLWGYGEPFLNPDIFAMIDYAQQAGIQVITSTNGNFLEGRIDRIAEAPLQKLVISLDGASSETYNHYRQKGDFAQVTDNLKKLAAHPQRQATLEIQFIIMRHNEHEVDKIKKLAAKWQVDKLNFKSVWFLDPRLNKRFQKYQPRQKRFQRQIDPAKTGWCIRPWHDFTVLWDGQVTACCYDPEGHLNLGNIIKDDFRDIWHGVDFQEYRQHMKDQIAGTNFYYFCRNCPENTNRRLEV